MDECRPFAVHHFVVLVEHRVDAVVFQNATGHDLDVFEKHAVQRFDWENLNSAKMHPAFNTAVNYVSAITTVPFSF